MGNARELLANAVNNLISVGKTSHRKIVANGGPSNGPLGRLRNQEDDVGIDTLDRLATATGLQPWQLLHPQGHKAQTTGELSEEALAIARALDRLQDDPRRRDFALRLCEIAVSGSPPSSPAQMLSWVAEVGTQLLPSVEHEPSP